MAGMTNRPYVRADFNARDEQGRAILGCRGMDAELKAQNAVLTEGMEVLLWDDDLDDQGERVLQVFDGQVLFDAARNCWLAVFDDTRSWQEPNPDRPWRWNSGYAR